MFQLLQLLKNSMASPIRTNGQSKSNLTEGRTAAAHGLLNRIRHDVPMCNPRTGACSTPKSPSELFQCCSLLSGFEYIGRRTYPDLSWPGPFSLSTLPYGSEPHLIHGSLGPPESTFRTASRSVQPFLQAHGRDRPTDRPRYSVCCNRTHLASAAMRPVVN